MGRGKRKSKNKQRKGALGLSGVAQVIEHPIAKTVTKGGLVLLTAIAAGGAGAALGKHSLVAGVPVTLIGFHKSNPYLIAAGLGLTLSNGFQNQARASSPEQGVGALDFKQIAEEAKDRVGTFFKNFSEKLYLTKTEPPGTSGLAGKEDDQVTYFINPYSTKELDMSAIDRVQEQIASMSKGTEGLNDAEVEREF